MRTARLKYMTMVYVYSIIKIIWYAIIYPLRKSGLGNGLLDWKAYLPKFLNNYATEVPATVRSS